MAEREVKVTFKAISDPALKEIGKLKKEVVGLGIAFLGLKGVKDIIIDVSKFSESLMKTKFSANLTNQEMIKFRDSLYNAALQTGTTSEAMLKMGQDALIASKDVEFVNQNMKLLGSISKVVGSEEGVGTFVSELHDRTKLTGKALENMVYWFISLSHQKGFKIRPEELMPKGAEVLKQISKIMPNATAEQIRTAVAGALFTDNPSAYLRAQRRLFQMMGNDKTAKTLYAMGFKSKDTVMVMDVIGKILKKHGTDTAAASKDLAGIFGRTGPEIAKLVTQYKAYAEAQKRANPREVAKQAAESAVTFESAMADMKTAAQMFERTELAKPLENFAKWLTKITQGGELDKIMIWARTMVPLVKDLAIAFAAWKIYKIGTNILGGLAGMGKGGIGLGALGSITNPMYVRFVGGIGPGGVPAGAPGGAGGGKAWGTIQGIFGAAMIGLALGEVVKGAIDEQTQKKLDKIAADEAEKAKTEDIGSVYKQISDLKAQGRYDEAEALAKSLTNRADLSSSQRGMAMKVEHSVKVLLDSKEIAHHMKEAKTTVDRGANVDIPDTDTDIADYGE